MSNSTSQPFKRNNPSTTKGKTGHNPQLQPKDSTISDEYRTFTFLKRCDPWPNNHSVLFDQFTNIRQLYVFGAEIGRGATGVVTECMDRRTNDLAACKTILKSALHTSSDVEDLNTEFSILQQMQGSPYAVRFYGAYEDSQCVHFIIENCEGGDLFSRIKERKFYSEKKAAMVIKTVASALNFAHKNGIIHRDIKPENILLVSNSSDTDVKLADFGAAAVFTKGKKLSHMVGSALYIAPTVLDQSYGEEADLWSLGVVLYILLSGYPPFWGRNNPETFRSIRNDSVNFRNGRISQVSMEAKELIQLLLNRDPENGFISAEGVLGHPWIKMHCDSPISPKPKRGEIKKCPSLINLSKKGKKISLYHFVSEEFRKRKSFSFGGGNAEEVCASSFVQELNPPMSQSPTKGVLYRPPTLLSPDEGNCGHEFQKEDSDIPIVEPIYL